MEFVWSSVIAAVGALVAGLVPFGALLALPAAQPGSVALVLGWPWGASGEEIATLVDLWPLGPEVAPLGALVMIETEADLIRLRENGAMLVADGKRVLVWCGIEIEHV